MYFNEVVLLGVIMLPTKSYRVTEFTTRDEKPPYRWVVDQEVPHKI